MIVVIGSRHDSVATALVDAWAGAALCCAEDLSSPGWVWSADPRGKRSWVVDGHTVDDADVTGVFLRRSTVYPEELLRTHPDDRAYLAAEAHAFLVFVLATTRARVANPVADGGLGDEALRPERWLGAAAAAGLPIAPMRLTNRTVRHRAVKTAVIEIVGERAFGDAPARTKRGAIALAQDLGVLWAAFVFDGCHRLVTITSAKPPGEEAAGALGRLLAGDGAS